MQRGSIYKKNGSWHVRFRVDEIGEDGLPRRREITKRLAPVDDNHRSKAHVRDYADREVAKANKGGSAEGSLQFKIFVENYYLPSLLAAIKDHKKHASTHKFYRDTLALHVTPAIGHIRLRDLETVHVQRMLDGIVLSQNSLERIKSAASAVMSYAIRLGYIKGGNPVHDAKPDGTPSDFEAYSYSWNEVQEMLGLLDEPARTVVAVAAFTGIRESELRGLKWEDFTGNELFIRRGVWRRDVGLTKTKESKARVPVVAPLRKMLEAHRKLYGKFQWIFAGPRGFALDTHNLVARVIKPAVGDRWHGWQAFRRGLMGILFGAGIDVEIAKVILRHSDSAVTRRHYLVLKSQREARAAMKKLEKVLVVPSRKLSRKKKPSMPERTLTSTSIPAKRA